MNLARALFVSCLALVVPTSLPAQTGLENGREISVSLGGLGHDMAIDDSRSLIYVSVPSLNEIVAVSSLSLQVVGRMSPGNSPRGIDISGDASTLYVALHGAGSVAVVDLGTFTLTTTIDVSTLLDHSTTWDVAEGMPGEVFVSANPGSGGFAYIVRIDRNNGNAAARVASNRIIRAGPTFRVSQDRRFLYVGEGFSPNSLYKLDITQPSAPLILEDNHGSVSGTQHTALEPNGARIFLSSGQVLSTASFGQTGMVGAGVSVISRSGDWAFVIPTAFGSGPDKIEVYDTASLALQQTISMQCNANSAATVRALEQDRGVIVLADDLLCGRVLPAGNICSFPGTGDDLRLITQGNTLGCKEVDVNDLVTVQLSSPNGGMVGSIPVLAMQLHDGINLPVPPPQFPGLQLDPWDPNSIVVFQFLGGGGIGPFLLPAQGMVFAFQAAPALATWSLRVQAIAFSPNAANGTYGTTDAHDLAFVTGPAPAISSIIPMAAPAGSNVTVLGSDFEPGLDLWVDSIAVTPIAQTAETLVFVAPPNMTCDTTIVVRNPGGRRITAPFNPEPQISSTVNASGPAAGGTPLVMLGTGFLQGMTVTVGGANATVLSVTSNALVVSTPPGTPGQVQAVATSPNGCTVTTPFTYQ